MLVATFAFGIALGFALGFAVYSNEKPANYIDTASAPPETGSTPPGQQAAPRTPVKESETPPEKPATATPPPPVAQASAPAVSAQSSYPGGRHLFVTVNGQWLADAAKQMLADLKPGGVLLAESNLGSRAQTFALVKEIKAAANTGDGLGDLPLIAVQQEGGPYNFLGLADAPSAETVAASGDPDLARRLGREYAEACVGRGIALVFAPVLDVYEPGAINPGMQARTFGTDYSIVTQFGLAMADGLREGGVLPVVKHFPGYGAATYGADGLLVVLNKDYSGLSRVLYPFNEAAVHGVPGVLVGHVAVPALDMDNQRRSAALSPVLVRDLLRDRWKFEGVILADDVAFNSMTRELGPEAATVQALVAGCAAVLMIDPDPDRLRSVVRAVSAAVVDGTLSAGELEKSVRRLERWQEAIGNLHPIAAPAESVRLAQETTAPPEISVTPPAPEPATTSEPEAQIAPPPSEPEVTAPPDADKVASAETPPVTVGTSSESEDMTAEESAPVTNDQPQEEIAPAPEKLAESPGAAEQTSESAEPQSTPEPAPPADATTEETERSSIVHTVKEGEQLSTIAELYNVALTDLVRWNELDSAQVEPGTALTIYLPDNDEESMPVAPDATTTTKTPEEPKETIEEIAVPAGKLVHTVVEGDTLSSIASQYKVSMADITLWNGLEEAALTPGQQLTIFMDPDAVPTAPTPTPVKSDSDTMPKVKAGTATSPSSSEQPRPATYTIKPPTVEYTIQSGDTLMKIARLYKTDTQTLMKLNDIKDPGKIFVGQKLKVPAPN